MAEDEAHAIKCPFCEFDDYDSSILVQHIDLCHPEDQAAAQWAATQHDTASHQQELGNIIPDGYVPCPFGCGETVAGAELPLHLDLHLAESLALDDSGNYDTGNPHGYTEDHLYSESNVLNSDHPDLPPSEERQFEAVPSKGIMKFIRKKKHSKSTDSNDRETKRLGVCTLT